MHRGFRFTLLALLLGLGVLPARAADKVRLENLLPQMTDLSLLSEYPDPPYVTKQFSSYDRASQHPGVESWFANGDRGFMLYDGVVKTDVPFFHRHPVPGLPPAGQFPKGVRVGFSPTHKPVDGYVWAYATTADGRAHNGKIPQGYVSRSAIEMDRQGHVLAEMDGPGCVVRIWSANPRDAGNIRIYLDGAERPVIEASLEALLAGKWQTTIDGKETTPFPDPIACERSRGFTLHFPIAYARHCKITVDRKDIYYHVDYRTYPNGTEVETFSLKGLAATSRQVQQIVEGLRRPVRREPSALRTFGPTTLNPGYSMRFSPEKGDSPQVITLFGARLSAADNAAAPSPAEAWRGVLLTMTFDGAPKPHVSCPLGDFFATSPGFQPYASLPFDVGPKVHDLMKSWWTMPFKKSVDIELRNLGRVPVKLDFMLGVDPYTWTDRSMHFHAKWRAETLHTRPFRDWTFCDIEGKGVFVGDMLTLVNSVRDWWGEGDEKIFVDGESFPSWFGTGTEDYYSYAWSDPTPFQHAYHNQTRCDGPGNRGWTSVNRFHILDDIPFEKSFRFDMEFWHWKPNIDVPYAATSYWYARPGATDDFHEPNTKTLQTLPAAPPPAQAYRIKGALEGEKLRIAKKSSDFDVDPQDMTAFGDGNWSGASHLWGRPGKVGEWVDLKLPVKATGRYDVIVYLTKARDYGVVRFNVNGQPLGPKLDCYHANGVVVTGAIPLGTVELQKGTATLRVQVVGTNPKSDGLRYMWGLDCVVLKPADQ
jgi:Protein of unknown function (DUF2961)